MNLKPLADRIVVRPAKEVESTASGIIIPDTASKERPEQGEIIAVGPGRLTENGTRIEMGVKVGDKIMFKKYSPSEIKVDGKEFLILDEHDVLVVIE